MHTASARRLRFFLTDEVDHDQVQNYVRKHKVGKATLGRDSQKLFLVLGVRLQAEAHWNEGECNWAKKTLACVGNRAMITTRHYRVTYHPARSSSPCWWTRPGTSWTGMFQRGSSKQTGWCRSAECTASRRRRSSASWAFCARIRRRTCTALPWGSSWWRALDLAAGHGCGASN